MEILVLSDSHGKVDHMVRAVEQFRPRQVLHLGDCVRDAQALERQFPQLPVTMVPGNCDWGQTGEPERLLEIEGVRILMMHGHTRHVKSSPMAAVYASREYGADVLLFGHTHVPLVDYDGALWVMNPGAAGDAALRALLEDKLRCHVERLPAGRFQLPAAEKRIRQQFGDDAARRLPRDNPAAMLALGALLDYLHDTQKTDLNHVDRLDYYRQGQFMELDLTARRNLELTETLRGKEKKGSLLWVLDKTRTAMGARLLRSWLERPLLSVSAIARRSDAVAALVKHTVQREELILALTGIGDMERLMGRIVYGSAGGRDMVSLKNAMDHLPAIRQQLAAFEGGHLRELGARLDPLEDLAEVIGKTLQDDPPFSVREGEFIRDGFDPEVDRLRGILHGGKGFIADIEAREKEKTGIKSLKDAKGKVVNIGNPGSGNRQNAIDVFEAAGINIEKDLKAESIKAADAPRMLQDGRIDGFFYTVGHPNGNIKEATAGKRKTRIVSITDIEPLVKKFPYYSLTNIDMAQYPEATNANEKVTTVGMLATFVTSAKVPDDVVYAITKEVFENLDEFKKLHPALEGLTRETMLEGLTAPIHPGALKYYKEAGLMK